MSDCSDILGAINALAQSTSGLKQEISRINQRLDTIERKQQELINGLNKLQATINDVKRVVQNEVAKIQQSINSLKDVIIAAINSSKELLLGAISGLKDVIIAYLNNVKDIIIQLIKSLLGGGDKDAITKAINDAKNAIIAEIKKINFDYSKLQQMLNGVITALTEVIKDYAFNPNDVIKPINAARDAVITEIKKISFDYNKIQQMLNGVISALTEVIKDYALNPNDIVRPINAARDAVINEIRKIKADIDYTKIQQIVNTATRAIIEAIENNAIDPAKIINAIDASKKEILNGLDGLYSYIGSKLDAGFRNLEILIKNIKLNASVVPSANIDYSKIQQIVNGSTENLLEAIRNYALNPALMFNYINRAKNEILANLKNQGSSQGIDYNRMQQISNASAIGVIDAVKNYAFNPAQLYNLINSLKNNENVIKRIYKILGGDRWFSNSEEAQLATNYNDLVDYSQAVFKDLKTGNTINFRSNGVIDLLRDLTGMLFVNLGLHELPQPYVDSTVNQPNPNNPIKVIPTVVNLIGLQELPASLPSSLIQKQNVSVKQTDIPSIVKLFGWYIERFDEIVGQWEIPIEIKDTDPTTPGDQSQIIKLPNIAETLAEMFQLMFLTNINSEVVLNIVMRNLAETGADKQQNFVTYKLLQSLTDWVGFKQKDIQLEMPLTFTLNKTRYDEILKESLVKVGCVEFDDKFGLEADLMRFREAAGILQAVYKRKLDPNGDIKGQILKYLLDTFASVNKVEGDSNDDEDDFEQFLRDVENGFANTAGIKNPTEPYGRNFTQRPRIRDLTNYQPPATE